MISSPLHFEHLPIIALFCVAGFGFEGNAKVLRHVLKLLVDVRGRKKHDGDVRAAPIEIFALRQSRCGLHLLRFGACVSDVQFLVVHAAVG